MKVELQVISVLEYWWREAEGQRHCCKLFARLFQRGWTDLNVSFHILSIYR